ncbi:ceramide kinase-like protein [Haliotis cracherodii]|uniref:ceramide kinase-like protein n=1 Tax=Haliotis cracherodii TaxID=6455 RepID=UPI0039EBF64F
MSNVKQTHFDPIGVTYDEDGNPKVSYRSEAGTSSHLPSFDAEEDITNIFDIAGEGYDVTLSLAQGRISWRAMNANGGKKKSKGLSSLFKSSKTSSKDTDGLDLEDAYGVKIRRRRRADQTEGEGFCLGFGLFTYEMKESANVLKDKILFFEHPSEDVCIRWVKKIGSYLSAIKGRPKTIKLFLQEHAGHKNGRSFYRHTILPMFKNADVSVDMTEVQHNEHIKQEMIHMNLEDFDCIVACGGDGTACKVADALLNRWQKDNDIDVKPGFTPARCHIPLGIIPLGLTNHIAGSVVGTVEPISAILHILYGHKQHVDVCSVYSEDKFLRWAFNSQYGFAGNVLSFRSRYSSLGAKKLDVAFIKALTKAKLRSYHCDVEYIPATGINTAVLNTPCRIGCRVCWHEDSSDQDSVTQDLVEELDPLANSGSSNSLIEIDHDSPWKTVKGSFMNVGVLTLPGRSEFAPNGLSKFTHLCDGNMDLVLVKDTDRKEFIRFLRRHGNAKNQFDFPFIEVHRVKEVRFRPRLPTSWKHRDHSFSEIDYEMSRLKSRKSSKSAEVLNDFDLDETFMTRRASRSDFRRADSVKALNGMSDSDNDDDDSGDCSDDLDGDNDERQRRGNPRRRQSEPVNPLHQKPRYVGPQYRLTFTEQERAKRQKAQRKKEEKAKKKEESRLNSYWNLDNELCQQRELDFRVHHGLLQICGEGVSPDCDNVEVTMTCLQLVK